MGTWGSGNIQSDGALEILAERSRALFRQTLELAGSQSAAEYDEYDHDVLFVNLETIFALHSAGLLRDYPEPGEIEALKSRYLAAWDEYVSEEGDDQQAERREIISGTFDRWRELCAREHGESAAPPVLVEHEGAGVDLEPCNILGHLTLALPVHWTKITPVGEPTPIPVFTLTHTFVSGGGELAFGTHPFVVDDWFASWEPQVSAKPSSPHRAYVFIARVRLGGEGEPPISQQLALVAEEQLGHSFFGKNGRIDGNLGFCTRDGSDFTGCQTFSCVSVHKEGDHSWRREIYFRAESEGVVLIVEAGSLLARMAFCSAETDLVEAILGSLSTR